MLHPNIRVFVSHKQEDSATATEIAGRLQMNGLAFYLDVVDALEIKDGPDLGDYLRQQLGRCTQLLAIVSHATQQSWWVPWEIGVASEKEYPLATYLISPSAIPSYLRKWPYLQSLADVDSYCDVSKKVDQTLNESVTRGVTVEAARHDSFRSFHRMLKSELRQE